MKKPFGLFTDSEFSEARKSLDAAMKEATKENRGLRKRKAGVIFVGDEEKIWKYGILRSDNPIKLHKTMIYVFALQFGKRNEN